MLIFMSLTANAQWISTKGPQGGYISCFAASGTDEFAGTYAGGIFRSSDNGITWTAINNGLPNKYIGALAVSGSYLFAGTRGQGVYFSSDNGENWTAVNSGLTNTDITALLVSGTNLFAGTAGGGVFLSTDYGSTWDSVSSGITNLSITCLATNGSEIYAGTGGSGVFRSTNNGASWNAANTGISSNYINSLVLTGSYVIAATYGDGVYRSSDSGTSWAHANSGITNMDVFALALLGSDLYAATKDGGIFHSSSNGSSWMSVNTGLTSNTVRALGINGTTLFAGTSTGIFHSTNYGFSWTEGNSGLTNKVVSSLYSDGTSLFAGTMGGMFVSENRGVTWQPSGLGFTSVHAIVSNGSYIFAGTWEGVWRSSDNGSTWSQQNTMMRWLIVNSLVLNGTNLFAGTFGSGVLRSADDGFSWTQVNSGLTDLNANALATDGSNLYAGTNNGVFISSNNGASWSPASNGLTNMEIHALFIDGTKIYAGTSDGIFQTTDNGANWNLIIPGVYACSFAKLGTKLYAGSWQTVYLSNDNGASFTEIKGGLPGTIDLIKTLCPVDDDLFAGTEGEGVWTLSPNISDGVWSEQNTQMAGTRTIIDQISVIDSNIVWVNGVNRSGQGRFIQAMARTNDGGVTWTPGNYNGFGSYIFPAFLCGVSYNRAFCCTYDTVTSAPYFWKTVDGGANWTTVSGMFNNGSSWCDGVKFWDHGKGFCYGDPVNNYFEIYITSDSGITWTQVPNSSNPTALAGEYGFTDPTTITITPGGTGYFSTSMGRIYKTSDYGATWSVLPSMPFSGNTTKIYASGNNYLVAGLLNYVSWKYTSNGGATWDTLTPGGNFYQYRLCNVPNTGNMFVGIAPWSNWKGIGFSYDGGQSWSDFNDPAYLQLNGSNKALFSAGFYNPPFTAIASATNTTVCAGNEVNLDVAASSGSMVGWAGNYTSPFTYNSILNFKYTPVYTYSWTSSPEGFYSNEQNPVITPTQTTTYFVSVSNGISTVYDTILINVIAPSLQASSFTLSSITDNSLNIGWTRGNGTGVIVIARQGSNVNADPSSGTSYTADSVFGNGSETGSGNYVVYNGTGTSVNVTNLLPGITYYFAVYEYDQASYCYLSPALSGQGATSGSYQCASLNYLATKAQSLAGSYVDLGSDGTVITTSDFDDANSAAQNIGFPFDYNCQTYSQFILNTNGFIKLGSTPPSTAALFFDGAQTAGGGIFNSTDPADVSLIAAFNHDLTAGTGTPEYRVYTSGTTPNRVCTIQFKNVRDKTTTPAQQFDNIQFQIKLYETTNIIEFVYGDWTSSANASAFKTSACGLKGSSDAGNELLVVNKGSASPWSAVTFSNANYSTTATLNFGNPPARPKPDAGRTYRFTPTQDNDLMVNEIYSLGEATLNFSNPQHIAVNIKNTGNNNITNFYVALNVSGANNATDTLIIPVLNSGESTTVNFSDFSASSNGATIITVSLPNDDNNADNTKTWSQNTNNSFCNYSSTAAATNAYGYQAGGQGIFYAKYHVTGSANVSSVKAFIDNYADNTGQTVFAIVLNSSGAVVGQSDNYVIQSGDLGNWHTFTINNPPAITDADFYAGFAVTATISNAYYAMGVQNENPARPDAFFYSDINGYGLTQYDPVTVPYRFMIGAELTPVSQACSTLNYLATKAQNIPGSYVDLGSNGTVITTSDFDDANSAAQNIGFDFEYDCQTFSQFVLNTNGFIKLGSTPPSSAALFFDGAQTAGSGIFNSTNPFDVNLIAVFNHDLMAGTETPEYRVYTSGTMPNRVCTIQYKNVSDKTTSPARQYDNMQFQIKLYETTNVIEFVYGDWTPSVNESAFKTSACGLKGSVADNQLLVVNKASTQAWDGVTFSNSNYVSTATLNFGNPSARPKPDAGRTYRFTPKQEHDLTVGEIYSLGDASLNYSNPQHTSVNIINTGYSDLSNVPVTLTVSGANNFTDTKYITSILAGENTIVAFNDFNATANGPTTLTISLPNDDYNGDNTKSWAQNTNDYICNYSSTAESINGFGYTVLGDPSQSASGAFEVKYHVTGSAVVNSVKAYLNNYAQNAGNIVYAIVMDQSGTIIAQSDAYMIQPADLGAWHTFAIPYPPVITNSYFYAGMAVTTGSTVYYPMGVQVENPSRADAYFSSAIDGSGLAQEDPATFKYRFMLGAILSPLPPVAGTAHSDTSICEGNPAVMHLTGYYGAIQWQQSADGINNWTNVSGGTGVNSDHYTSGNLLATTFYRAEVTQPTYAPEYSNVITVTVNNFPVADAGSNVTYTGSPVQLGSASSGPGSFSWLPVSGLNDPNLAQPQASPSVMTTYTLTVNNNGCIATDEVTVNVGITGHMISGKTKYAARANTGNPAPNLPTYNQVIYNIGQVIVILKSYPAGAELARDTSDSFGYYQFNNVADGNYKLTYHKYAVDTVIGGNDINVADVSMLKYYIGSDTILDPSRNFSSKYKKAVNVDNNAYLNVTDVSRIKSKIGSPYNTSRNFPKGNWVTMDKLVTVAGSDVSTNLENICYGDFNASSTKYRDSLTTWNSVKSLPKEFIIPSDELITITGQSYFEIPMKIGVKENDLSALGLEISYPASEYKLVSAYMPGVGKNISATTINPTLDEIIANDNDLLVTDEDGIIRVVYATTSHFDVAAGDKVLVLGFRPLKPLVSGELEFNLSGTGVIADMYGNENEDAFLVMPKIFVQDDNMEAGFEFSGYPNPFSGNATLSYSLPENGSVKIEVFNAIGELVSVPVNEMQAQGKHTAEFASDGLPAGMYTFRLEFTGTEISKSMVLKLVH